MRQCGTCQSGNVVLLMEAECFLIDITLHFYNHWWWFYDFYDAH